MKIKILKRIKISEVGKTVLPVDDKETYEVSDNAGKILVKRKYAKEIKPEPTGPTPTEVVAKIEAVTKVEDLKVFEADKRKKVIEALKAAKEKLTPKV